MPVLILLVCYKVMFFLFSLPPTYFLITAELISSATDSSLQSSPKFRTPEAAQ